jgi:Kef-type K+ transport system membrane component KefB
MSGEVAIFIRDHLLTLPSLAKFAVGMMVFVGVPRICRRIHVPEAVGLLLAGVIVGPYVLGVFGAQRPIAEFMADLGKLLLMFFAGLDIDLALFSAARNRSVAFGLATTTLPLLFGTVVFLFLGYGVLPAIVVGSLLASHTLLGLKTIERLGLMSREPIVVAMGATVMSDTLSLVVFAICVSTFQTGFSIGGTALLIGEIVAYILVVLFVVSRVAGWLLARFENEEDAYFIIMLAVMAVSGVAAEAIQLPGIVGAFLAGLAVNASARDKPASLKLDFIAKSLFIPCFFVVTGFLINPVVFITGIRDNFLLVAGMIGALLAGKWLAADGTGRLFGYSAIDRKTVWSLTLPQVAATLAAALVAFNTVDHAGHRLIDQGLLNAVLVLMLVTAILGPVLTDRFAPRMLEETQLPQSDGSSPDAAGPDVGPAGASAVDR